MTDLTHVKPDGTAQMVDVGNKPVTIRTASAQAVVTTSTQVITAINTNTIAKGDVLSVARIAAIMAAKRVDQLIPLCHSLPLAFVEVNFSMELDAIRIVCSAATSAQTGVEMEALTAATVAALTIYDMVKAMDKRAVISDIHLLSKTGGKSGDFKW